MSTIASAAASTAPADPFAALNQGKGVPVTRNEAGSADRFLKLLVAQMKNQDPLNPMDNAEVTSQMAQINTVDGINRLNDAVGGLNTQFVRLQALQGASLLGREVTLPGDRLSVTGAGADATGSGGFVLAGPADAVRLEVLDAAGLVVGTMDLGARKAGTHSFEWAGGDKAAAGQSFRITASRSGQTVAAEPLMHDRVLSVSAGVDQLQLELQRLGSVAYADVRAVRTPPGGP